MHHGHEMRLSDRPQSLRLNCVRMTQTSEQAEQHRRPSVGASRLEEKEIGVHHCSIAPDPMSAFIALCFWEQPRQTCSRCAPADRGR